jgi:hypothetical protein
MATVLDSIVAGAQKAITLPENLEGNLESGYELVTGWIEGDPPVPSSYSGTFVDGNSITIVGTNFSADENAVEVYKDFTEESLNARASGMYYWSGGGADFTVQSVSNPFGSRVLRSHAIQEQFQHVHYEFATGQTEVYMEAFCRINKVFFDTPTTPYDAGTTYDTGDAVTVGSQRFKSKVDGNIGNTPQTSPSVGETAFWAPFDGAQVKAFRIFPGTGETSMQASGNTPLSISSTIEITDCVVESRPSIGGSSGWFGTNPSNSEWAKYVLYIKKGQLDTATGERFVKIGADNTFTFSGSPVPPASGGHFGSPNATVAATEFRGEGITNHITSSAGDLLQRVSLPYFHRAGEQETIVDVAYFYVKNSREGIVIGDASTWATCDHTKTHRCKITARTNNSISFVAQDGQFPTGALYAYIVNKDGVYNSNGILVRAA